jgi:hypothetical protein
MKEFTTPKGTTLPLLDMRGKPYLQVAHRLVWFREERPTWSIETEPMELTQTSTYFKATIRDAEGRLMATAHKFEDKQGFTDHREKAETGAVGRALALIGYGTQFCADDLNEGERDVDTPIEGGRTTSATLPGPGSVPKLAPECCGGPMQLSRYNPNERFCSRCKAKSPATPASRAMPLR